MDKQRFKFGKNWKQFLTTLNEERIHKAEDSLKTYLNLKTLKNKKFLDVGCGSGLFSLAAKKLEAEVYSFDYDQQSVECTKFLKNKFFAKDQSWIIEQGSVLDPEYLEKFKDVDIVYSWGVLHHTGDMKQAFKNILSLPKVGGFLFISIYNDQGPISTFWKWLKKTYVSSGKLTQLFLTSYVFLVCWGPIIIKDTLKSFNPLKTWKAYSKNRGMSAWHDIVDWAGGYPFEVGKPEEIFDFFKTNNYELQKMTTRGGKLGCNEFLFKRMN